MLKKYILVEDGIEQPVFAEKGQIKFRAAP